MNICMFTNTYLPHVGGVARSVAFFTEDLRKRGHRVLVVAPTFPNDDEVPTEEKGVLRVPAIQNFNGSDFSVRIPLPFIINEKIDEFKPEVIHSHHPFLLGYSAVRTAFRRKLPLVFTHHTLYEEYTHYVSSDSKVMKLLAVHLSTEYANLCTRVVAPSESISDLITNRGVNPPITVIPTGVDIDYFRSGNGGDFRRLHDIPMDVPVIGHLGRLAAEKNLEYLCEAVLKALKKIPAEARFLVVGAGPSESLIREMFNKKALEDRLIMAGKLSGPDLADAYKAMDLFVFSSKSETQGMVLVEAMAAGIPVIALDASGTREVVEDNQNGRLLPENTSSQVFAETIIDFFERARVADSWCKAADDTARKFSRDVSAEKLIRIYQSVREEKLQEQITEKDAFDPWDKLLISLKTEWEIISEKAKVIIQTVQEQYPEK
jgi:glycosyltransferase involved in cell wall biosynthesis